VGHGSKPFFKVVLVGILLGSMFSLENRLHLMRTRKIELYPPHCEIEEFLWDSIDAKSMRFWPKAYLELLKFKGVAERQFPVKISINIVSWGSFGLSFCSLQPKFLLRWSNGTWAVADNGSLWDWNDPEFIGLYPSNTTLPTVTWTQRLPVPFETALGRRVHVTLLPVSQVLSWLQQLGRLGWLEQTSVISVDRQGGHYRIHVTIHRPDRRRLILLLSDDLTVWPLIAQALDAILKDNPQEAELVIDATYDGKLIVK
jgi:hypothetical protein